MYITIDHASQFRDQFRQAGRGDQFSYEALNMLYEYLEDIDPQYELDVIALCCDYAEATPAEIANDYNLDVDTENEDATFDAVREYLDDHSHIVGITSSGSIVYQQF
jgi:hypothetical protein